MDLQLEVGARRAPRLRVLTYFVLLSSPGLIAPLANKEQIGLSVLVMSDQRLLQLCIVFIIRSFQIDFGGQISILRKVWGYVNYVIQNCVIYGIHILESEN